MDEPKKPFWMPDAQGFVMGAILFISAICVFYRMTHPSPADDKLLDMMLTIIFSSCLVAIVNFLFGSSRGSAAKEDTQSKIIERLTPPMIGGSSAAIVAAAEAAAPAAAAQAAPPAAAEAAPPAVDAELDRRGVPDKPRD